MAATSTFFLNLTVAESYHLGITFKYRFQAHNGDGNIFNFLTVLDFDQTVLSDFYYIISLSVCYSVTRLLKKTFPVLETFRGGYGATIFPLATITLHSVTSSARNVQFRLRGLLK